MNICRICNQPIDMNEFCPSCGIRYKPVQTIKTNLFFKLTSSVKEFLTSEKEKQAKKYINEGFQKAIYGYDACIPYHEKATNLNPKYKSILATTYLGAADERLGMIGGGGLFSKLKSTCDSYYADKILECIKNIKDFKQSFNELDKLFNDAMSLYQNAITLSNHCEALPYCGRARAFHETAVRILLTYGIFHFHANLIRPPIIERMKYFVFELGKAQLGTYYQDKKPEIKNINQILWFFEKATEDYREAIKVDPTSSKAYCGLFYNLNHLGMKQEAFDNLNKALLILNKAIQADTNDAESYKERAIIFEELGEFIMEISDLEHLLTISHEEFNIQCLKDKLTSLREISK
jgi:tetratricopeptide (TPR) repeat protein